MRLLHLVLEDLTSLAAAVKDCSLLNCVQCGFMVRSGKSSWVTCVKDKPQQTMRLIFKKNPTKQNYKQKTRIVQEGKVSPQQRAALLPKWDLDAEVQE